MILILSFIKPSYIKTYGSWISPDPQIKCFTRFYYLLNLCQKFTQTFLKKIFILEIILWIWITQIKLRKCVFNPSWPLHQALNRLNQLIPPPNTSHSSLFTMNKRTRRGIVIIPQSWGYWFKSRQVRANTVWKKAWLCHPGMGRWDPIKGTFLGTVVIIKNKTLKSSSPHFTHKTNSSPHTCYLNK